MKQRAKPWKLLHRIVHLESPWITVYADKLEDGEGKQLEYWHFDRADSVVVLAMRDGAFLLPRRQFRPGVGEATLDFVGGRIQEGQTPEQAAAALLKKELGVDEADVLGMKPVTPWPLAVDSSFSSQKLYGIVARISEQTKLSDGVLIYDADKIDSLREDLRCPQCRVLLNEYLLST